MIRGWTHEKQNLHQLPIANQKNFRCTKPNQSSDHLVHLAIANHAGRTAGFHRAGFGADARTSEDYTFARASISRSCTHVYIYIYIICMHACIRIDCQLVGYPVTHACVDKACLYMHTVARAQGLSKPIDCCFKPFAHAVFCSRSSTSTCMLARGGAPGSRAKAKPYFTAHARTGIARPGRRRRKSQSVL